MDTFILNEEARSLEAQENQIFINRELSWLDFNRRVLALSKDKTVPLAEQMKFAAIYGSNLDEFFMVRVGSLYDRTLLKNEITENKTNMTAAQQLAAIMPKTAELQEQCDKNVFRLRERLAEVGYRRIDFEKLDREDEKFWKKYFQNELYPVLSPQIIDHRHPFPFLRNQEIYLCATLKAKGDEEVSFGLIPIGSQFERLLYLKKEETVEYGLAEELIFHSITTGASNDIEQATRMARAMITRYGMSDEFGMVALETINNQYLGGDTSLACSAQTQREIDQKVVELVKTQHEKAIRILTENRAKLDELAQYLYQKETITGEEFMEILNREPAQAQ